MLHVVLRDDYPSLVQALTERLQAERDIVDPLERAMAREWIVTPSTGTKQWLTRELSKNIGATPGCSDGIVANWLHEFPSRLSGRVLDAHLAATTETERDPWALPQLQFAILDWAQRHPTDTAVKLLKSGNSPVLLARARYYADLFDRYHVWRPDMVLSWLDDATTPTDPEEFAQRSLWRAVRQELNIASPPERFHEAFDYLDAHPEILPVKDRLSIFGLTSFPGGERFIEVLHRLSKHIDCTAYLVDGFHDVSVNEKQSASEFASTLLRLWGGAPVANAPLLAKLEDFADRQHQMPKQPQTLLQGLQYTLRTDEVQPVTGGDSSIIEHRCYGPQRQAEVLRDAIRHDLLQHPDWTESDLLVVCPDIELFSPLIRTAFGPSRRGASTPGDPALAYKIFDSTKADDGLHLQALRHLLRLMSSQFTRSDVLSFLAEPDVSRRRRLAPEDHEYLSGWSKDAGVRWGLNSRHRAVFGLAALGDINTWSKGIERLQLGFMVENPAFRAVDELLPVEIPGSKFELLSNLSQIIDLLIKSFETSEEEKSLTDWFFWFDELVDELIRPDSAEHRQVDRVRQSLSALRQVAAEQTCSLSFSDFSRLLDEAFDTTVSLGALFTGGITITGPDTLRWVRFKATYLVGFDDGAFMRPDLEADDLRRGEPRHGEISPNDDARSRLSELILSTTERLTVLRTSHDLSTGEELDPAITFSEFLDGILELSDPRSDGTDGFFSVVQHPRQSFDTRNFADSGEFGHLKEIGVLTQAWSFSELDVAIADLRIGAQRNDQQPKKFSEHLELTSSNVDLPSSLSTKDLRSFLENPPKSHLRWGLGIFLANLAEERTDSLDGEFNGGLKSKTVGEVFRSTVRDKQSHEEDFSRLALTSLAASGDVPPQPILPLEKTVNEIEDFYEKWMDFTSGAKPQMVGITLPIGQTVLIDQIEVFEIEGQLHVVEVITSSMKFHKLLGAWLKALAVRAAMPAATKVALTIIYRPGTTKGADFEPSVKTKQVRLVSESPADSLKTLDDLAALFEGNLTSPLPYDIQEVEIDATGNFKMNYLTEDGWGGTDYSGSPRSKYLKDRNWRAVFSHLTADDINSKENAPSGRKTIHKTLEQSFRSPFDLFSIALIESKPQSS